MSNLSYYFSLEGVRTGLWIVCVPVFLFIVYLIGDAIWGGRKQRKIYRKYPGYEPNPFRRAFKQVSFVCQVLRDALQRGQERQRKNRTRPGKPPIAPKS